MRYLKKIGDILLIPLRFKRQLSILKSKGYKAIFESEGDIEINLPKASLKNIFTKSGRNKVFKAFMFTERPKVEPLLRKVVNELFQIGYLNYDKSIIDIGCWIGDNSLVWAKMLKKGRVFAIEGISESLKFASETAMLNNINNVNFTYAICADVSDLSVISSGSQSGTYFKQTDLESRLRTTTIDKVIPIDYYGDIDLFHIDVEGFEEKVILGAKNVIESSRPVIIFEQHISSQNVGIIISFLEKIDYKIFMINEVLPGNEWDCRNFIAFDSRKPLPQVTNLENSKGIENNVFFATLGSSIIEVDL